MSEKLNEFMAKNPQSYLGYYAAGLMELDSYFLYGSLISEINMEKALELRKDDKIIKYYFMTLLAQDDKKKIKKFYGKYKKELNEYKFMLVLEIVRYYRSRKKDKVINLSDEKNYDYLDYLLLDILQSKGIIDNNGENYIYKSLSKGRKSRKLVEAIFLKRRIPKEIVDEDFIEKYPDKLVKLSNNREIYLWILDKDLIKKVNKKNRELVQSIILNNIGHEKCQMLIRLYEEFCLKTDYSCQYFIDSLGDHRIKIDTYNHKFLRYYCNPSIDASFDRTLQKMLSDKAHFYKKEVEVLHKMTNSYLMFKTKHMYRLNINIPINEEELNISIAFKNYNVKETFNYVNGVENYYFLPDEISFITIMLNKGIITIGEESFTVEKVANSYERKLFSGAAQYLNMNYNSKKENDRIALFLYFNNPSFEVNKFNSELYRNLFNSNIMFKHEHYYGIVKRLFNQRSYVDFDNYMLQSIENEYLRLRLSPEAVHAYVDSEDNLNNSIKLVLKAQQNGVEIWIRTMLLLIKKALKKKSFDAGLAISCELFIYNNAVINEDISNYLINCYEKLSIHTEYTKKSIEIINTYIKDDEKISRLNLFNLMHENQYNYSFYSELERVYEATGADNETVYEAVCSMLHHNAINYDKNFLDMIGELYKNHPNNYVLLKHYVLASIDSSLPIPKDYLIKLRDYIMAARVINSEINKIMLYMVEKEVPGIENYFSELFKYEVLHSEDLPKGEIFISSRNMDSLRIVNDGIVSEFCVPVGYCYDFKAMASENQGQLSLERSKIKKYHNKFVEWFDKVDSKEFKSFAGEVCVVNNILDVKILDYCFQHNEDYWDKAAVMLVKEFGLKDKKKTLKYMKKLIDSVDILPMEFIDAVLKMCDENMVNTASLLMTTKKDMSSTKLEYIIRMTALKALNSKDVKALNIILTDCIDNINSQHWLNIYCSYVKSLKDIGKTEYSVIIKAFAEAQKNGMEEEFIRAFIEVECTSYMFGSLLYQIHQYKEDSRIKELCMNILIAYPENCSVAMASEIIQYFGLNMDFKKQSAFLSFADLCGKNEGMIKSTIDIARKYLHTNIEFSRELLKIVSSKSEEAKLIYDYLASQSKQRIQNYSIDKKLSSGSFGEVYKAYNLMNNNDAYALKLTDASMYNLIVQYFKSVKLKVIFEDRWILFEGVNIKDAVENSSLKEMMKIAASLVYFQSILFKNKLPLNNFSEEQLIIIEGAVIPLNIVDDEAVNIKNDDLSEEKVCTILIGFILTMFSWSENKTEQLEAVREVLKGSESIGSINALAILLRDILSCLENSEQANEFVPKKHIALYPILNEKQKNMVIEYMLENDIFMDSFFESILYSIVPASKKLFYLVNYCNDYSGYYKSIIAVIKQYQLENPDIVLSKEDKNNLIIFLRRGIKQCMLEDDTIKDILDTKLIDQEDIISLSMLIENMRASQDEVAAGV